MESFLNVSVIELGGRSPGRAQRVRLGYKDRLELFDDERQVFELAFINSNTIRVVVYMDKSGKLKKDRDKEIK